MVYCTLGSIDLYGYIKNKYIYEQLFIKIEFLYRRLYLELVNKNFTKSKKWKQKI